MSFKMIIPRFYHITVYGPEYKEEVVALAAHVEFFHIGMRIPYCGDSALYVTLFR